MNKLLRQINFIYIQNEINMRQERLSNRIALQSLQIAVGNKGSNRIYQITATYRIP